jgi:hypothetical protein
MTYPASGTLRSRRKLALADVGLILIAGLIHLLLTPQHFVETGTGSDELLGGDAA